MAWNRVGDWGGRVKIHLATDSTATLLKSDLENRFDEEFNITPLLETVVFFEEGHLGMTYINQPTVVLRFNNHPIEFYCRQALDLCSKLGVKSIRTFSDGTLYTKLHSSYNCLVLSEDERHELLGQLLEVGLDAEAAYNKFLSKLPEMREEE